MPIPPDSERRKRRAAETSTQQKSLADGSRTDVEEKPNPEFRRHRTSDDE